jgi:hypothetical protein
MKTTFTLTVAGMGAVSPAGVGVARLLDGSAPRLVLGATLSPHASNAPAARVDFASDCWGKWRAHPRLRRAGALTLFLVEAMDQAARQAGLPTGAKIGLAVAFGNGVLTFTRKFYECLVEGGAAGANPAWFPETVFNAPLNHALGALGLEGPSTAWVGDNTALAQAWLTAGLWLEEGVVDAVIVAAAEEVDEAMLEVATRAGWYRRSGGVLPAEGAVAFVARRTGTPATSGVLHVSPGCPWGHGVQVHQALARVLEEFDSTWPIVAGTIPPPGPARLAWSQRPARPEWPATPWPALGEANAVSAAWNFARLLAGAPPGNAGVVFPLWGTSHQVAALGWEFSRNALAETAKDVVL